MKVSLVLYRVEFARDRALAVSYNEDILTAIANRIDQRGTYVVRDGAGFGQTVFHAVIN